MRIFFLKVDYLKLCSNIFSQLKGNTYGMCIGKGQGATTLDLCVAYFGFLIVLQSGDLAILASSSYFNSNTVSLVANI